MGLPVPRNHNFFMDTPVPRDLLFMDTPVPRNLHIDGYACTKGIFSFLWIRLYQGIFMLMDTPVPKDLCIDGYVCTKGSSKNGRDKDRIHKLFH